MAQTPSTPTLRRLTVALMIALVALTTIAPATAGAAGSRAAPPPHARCDLRDPNLSAHDEWGHCFTVEASLSAAPSEGEAATLSYRVRSASARPDATVSVDLPAGLGFAKTPEGASTRTRSGTGPGWSARATSHESFAAGQVQVFSAPLRAVASGPAEIVVRVTAPRPDGGVDAADDRVFLTVGGHGARASLTMDDPTNSSATPVAGTPVARKTSSALKAVPTTAAPPAAQSRAASAPAALTTVCVTGGWAYTGPDRVLRQAPTFPVQVWDQDSGSPDLLASGFTDGIGRFQLCYDNTDVDEGGLVDPSLTFVASNNRWRIRNTPSSNRTYTFDYPVATDQTGSITLGNLQPSDPSLVRVVQIYDAVREFWNWVPSNCWDTNDAEQDCRQIVVNWTPTSTDGTYYSQTNNDVHLAAADPDSRQIVIHEATHATMDDVYEDAYPDHPSCSPHYIDTFSSPGCAWSEGFAEWVPASVLHDPYYRWPDGGFLPLETPTWGTPGWDNGLGVEGRVAGAMIDTEDFTVGELWDNYAEGGPPRPQWTTFLNSPTPSPSYYVYFQIDRRNQGFDVGDRVTAAVFQNTINMAFYEPLEDHTELLRPTPVPHDYKFTPTTPTWSAVAVRTPASTNYDLDVYDNHNSLGLLGDSHYAAGVPDYVVIDSHRRPYDEVYPKVSAVSGSGTYLVEYAQSGSAVADGTSTVTFGANDVVSVADTALAQNVPTYFRAVPASGQNIELMLHGQLAATTSPVQGRAWAVETGSATGLGGAEAVSHTSTIGETAGLVLLNKEGAGTVTIYRDTTAPTGSVAINGGAASTASQTVTLTLSAADAQTGVDGMQISVDGIIDTEPVQPFATTKTVTLPAGTGTKTVRVRYRNRAGMIGNDVSDTITLGKAADLKVSSQTNPPATRADGGSFAVTDTTANQGTAASAASTTRYYLSLDATKGTGDVLLSGARAVPKLAVGATSKGTVTVTIPVGTKAGTYRLLACADDRKVVSESNELNNCRASTTTIKVT